MEVAATESISVHVARCCSDDCIYKFVCTDFILVNPQPVYAATSKLGVSCTVRMALYVHGYQGERSQSSLGATRLRSV